jgi:hypothetical protein
MPNKLANYLQNSLAILFQHQNSFEILYLNSNEAYLTHEHLLLLYYNLLFITLGVSGYHLFFFFVYLTTNARIKFDIYGVDMRQNKDNLIQ